MQDGDVARTYADVNTLETAINLQMGIKQFVERFKSYN
jgi:hypothetical protein